MKTKEVNNELLHPMSSLMTDASREYGEMQDPRRTRFFSLSLSPGLCLSNTFIHKHSGSGRHLLVVF